MNDSLHISCAFKIQDEFKIFSNSVVCSILSIHISYTQFQWEIGGYVCLKKNLFSWIRKICNVDQWTLSRKSVKLKDRKNIPIKNSLPILKNSFCKAGTSLIKRVWKNTKGVQTVLAKFENFGQNNRYDKKR